MWLIDRVSSWFKYVSVIIKNILKFGPIPNHVAFIPDGNRRYAKKFQMETVDGHRLGLDTMYSLLNVCHDLGIKEMTMYAFSIENFKRSECELSLFMAMVAEKLKKILEKIDDFNEKGICIRVIGNLDLIDEQIRKYMAQIVFATKDNTSFFLNFAFAYTSHDDITNSIKCIVDGVAEGRLQESDINEHLITNCLYTNKISKVDLIIRTSGNSRFSDFLLWNIDQCLPYFMNCLWPECSAKHLYRAILHYQLYYNFLQKTRIEINNLSEPNIESNPQVKHFLAYVDLLRTKQIEAYTQI